MIDGVMSPDLKPATFRLEREILDGLEEVKRRDGVSITEQVRRALKAWLASKDLTKQAASRRATTRRKA